MRRQYTYKKLVAAVLVVVASVTLMNVTGQPEGGMSFWQTLFLRAAGPFSRLSSGLIERFWAFTSSLKDKGEMYQENRRLREQLEVVASLQAQLENVRLENARLKELLSFWENTPGEYVVTKVIGRNPSKWFATVFVAAGEESGVYVDAPVVSKAGLVGRVTGVDKTGSTVLLLSDPESGVGACVQRTGDFGVLLGGGGPEELILKFFSRDAGVKKGDRVVTSGLGSKFPEGILIGEIVDVYMSGPGLVSEATVRPASDLDRLQEVLVMTR